MGIDGCVFACHTCASLHTHIVGEIAMPKRLNGKERYDEDGLKKWSIHTTQPTLWHVMLESMKSQTSKHPNIQTCTNLYRHSSVPEYFNWSISGISCISCISTANIRSTTKYLCENLWASSLEKQFIQNCVIWQTRSPSLSLAALWNRRNSISHNCCPSF